MLLSARGRTPSGDSPRRAARVGIDLRGECRGDGVAGSRARMKAARDAAIRTKSKVTWRDGAPCFRGHGASVAASRGMALRLLVELELARAATHFFIEGEYFFMPRRRRVSALRIDMEKVKLLKI